MAYLLLATSSLCTVLVKGPHSMRGEAIRDSPRILCIDRLSLFFIFLNLLLSTNDQLSDRNFCHPQHVLVFVTP